MVGVFSVSPTVMPSIGPGEEPTEAVGGSQEPVQGVQLFSELSHTLKSIWCVPLPRWLRPQRYPVATANQGSANNRQDKAGTLLRPSVCHCNTHTAGGPGALDYCVHCPAVVLFREQKLAKGSHGKCHDYPDSRPTDSRKRFKVLISKGKKNPKLSRRVESTPGFQCCQLYPMFPCWAVHKT